MTWYLYFMNLCLQMSSIQLVKLNLGRMGELDLKNQQLVDFSFKFT